MRKAGIAAAVATFALALGASGIQPTATAQSRETGNRAVYYKILNMHSKRCIVVLGSLNENPAVVTECGPWADQKWE